MDNTGTRNAIITATRIGERHLGHPDSPHHEPAELFNRMMNPASSGNASPKSLAWVTLRGCVHEFGKGSSGSRVALHSEKGGGS